MKTLAIVSRKGGAGKTTIALHLAVAAEAFGIATAVFDLDPQASAALWADHRGEQFPAVVPAQAPRLAALLAQARANDADLVILDTAPHADGIASEAASHADAILIPCRPSALDLDAIGASIRLARAVNKPAYVVINAAPVQGVETAETRTALAGAGVELAPMVLHQRKAYAARMHEGRTAQEIEPNGERERERRTGTANGNGKAAGEIRELMLWLCDKVGLLPKEQATKTAKQPA